MEKLYTQFYVQCIFRKILLDKDVLLSYHTEEIHFSVMSEKNEMMYILHHGKNRSTKVMPGYPGI